MAKEDFLNPFDEGVTYADFIKAMDKKTVGEYCKKHLTEDQIEFIENELSILKDK